MAGLVLLACAVCNPAVAQKQVQEPSQASPTTREAPPAPREAQTEASQPNTRPVVTDQSRPSQPRSVARPSGASLDGLLRGAGEAATQRPSSGSSNYGPADRRPVYPAGQPPVRRWVPPPRPDEGPIADDAIAPDPGEEEGAAQSPAPPSPSAESARPTAAAADTAGPASEPSQAAAPAVAAPAVAAIAPGRPSQSAAPFPPALLAVAALGLLLLLAGLAALGLRKLLAGAAPLAHAVARPDIGVQSIPEGLTGPTLALHPRQGATTTEMIFGGRASAA